MNNTMWLTLLIIQGVLLGMGISQLLYTVFVTRKVV